MSFIVENEIALVGMFPRNGFQTIKEGTALARTSALGGATVFPAELSIPDGISRGSLRPGISGSATAFAASAGVVGLLASILVWGSSYTAHLWPSADGASAGEGAG